MEPIRLNQEVTVAEALQFRCSTASRASIPAKVASRRPDEAAASFPFLQRTHLSDGGGRSQWQVSDGDGQHRS